MPGGAGGRPPASKQCLAAQHEGGTTQRRTDRWTASRRTHRRCVDQSADCCADWRTLSSERSEQRAARPRPRAAPAPPVGWQPSLRRGPPSGPALWPRRHHTARRSPATQPRAARRWVSSRWRGEKSAFKIPIPGNARTEDRAMRARNPSADMGGCTVGAGFPLRRLRLFLSPTPTGSPQSGKCRSCWSPCSTRRVEQGA